MAYRPYIGSILLIPALTCACLDRDVYSGEPTGIRPAVATALDRQQPTRTLNVLFVVDDSISMADKQKVLRASVERASLSAVRCFSSDGRQEVPPQNGVCPAGYAQHMMLPSSAFQGLVTSSLEAGGAAVCEEHNRRAHLFPRVSQQEELEIYGGQIQGQLANVGESGCGYEAPLEAMYRFLVDPEPPLRVTVRASGSTKEVVAEGVDEELLRQRAAFLQPFAHVAIVILTDEDDCSIQDSGDAWKVSSGVNLARATSACESGDGACCRPCDSAEVEPPPGCIPLDEDPVCRESRLWSAEEDPVNLRCWNQRRRFGKDWLYPIDRYTEALTSVTIVGRSGKEYENPLFANGRTRDMVSVLALTGVPWQLLTADDSPAEPGTGTRVLSPEQIVSRGVWEKILGDPPANVPPKDPHLWNSREPRAGLARPGDEWDPIHGHELVGARDDLQHSCLFKLPEPRECADGEDCECAPGRTSPLCREQDGTYGTTLHYAKAYPAPRILQFVRSLDTRGFLGSICPRQLDDPWGAGFGYSDAWQTFHAGAYGRDWDLSCFMEPLPLASDGTLSCKLLELHEGRLDCSAIGRKSVSGTYLETALHRNVRDGRRDEVTVCEIPPLAGDPRVPGTPAFRCANEAHPELSEPGYCYIDPALELGAPALVQACSKNHERRVRLIPRTTARPITTELYCDYGGP